MSTTKRMMEFPPQWTQAERIAQQKERIEAMASVFSMVRKYLVAYINANNRQPKSCVYKRLYPSTRDAPSQTKFYTDVKKAGGIPEYLTYHFYSNLQFCLESLDLPPSRVLTLITQTSDKRRWLLNLEDAGRFAPTVEELRVAAPLKPRPRKFRFHPKSFPDLMPAKAIIDFFTDVRRKNEVFYNANPQQLFNLDLLDYKDYLHSPFWFVIRNIVLFRDSFECMACGDKATCVHHLYYSPDVLYGKDLAALVSLCDLCHHKIEFDEAGAKIHNIEEKHRRYVQIKTRD